jgi:hypothetical protein
MTRHLSPSLLVTVHSLHGSSEQLGHLHLCLVQLLTGIYEFFTVHGYLREHLACAGMKKWT